MSAEKLAVVGARGLRASLWLEIRPSDAGWWTHLGDVIVAVWRFLKGSFSAISVAYRGYNDLVAFLFARVPIHLFTVNDRDALRELTLDPRVRIVLSDRPYHDRVTCSR